MTLSLVFFIILCAAAANFVGAVLPILARYAVRRGFTDRPAGRKAHDRPVPPIGGLVIVPVFMILLPILGVGYASYIPLICALTLLLVTGFLDDNRDLAPHWKFLGQGLASLIVVASGSALLPHLGHLFGVDHLVDLKWLSVPFTLVCFIFLINAMNMIDGLDGLAGGVSFVMLAWLAVAGLLGGDVVHAGAALLMMALLFGFLLHNLRYPGHSRATVFLGDAGSMAMGLIIAWLGVNIAAAPQAGMPPISMAFVIAVPIVDAFGLFIARRRAGRRAFQAGSDHLHHRLLRRNLSPARVTWIIMLFVFILGGIGVLGPHGGIGEGPLTFLWLFLLLGYTFYLVKRAPFLYQKDDEKISSI